MGMSGVRCLQWQCQFSEKEVIHIFFPSPSVSRRHGSFHPLKHKHRREPAASTWARSRLTTNVSYVYCVWVYGGNALFSTQHVWGFFSLSRKGIVLPPQVCHYCRERRQEKWVTAAHHEPTSCHMRCSLAEMAAKFCGSPMNAGCRLGCGFLNGLDWLVLSSEWSIVIFWGFENRYGEKRTSEVMSIKGQVTVNRRLWQSSWWFIETHNHSVQMTH